MSDNFRAKLVLIAIVLSAFALPVLAANTGCPGDSHGSYGTRKTLWYKALGPDHSDVTAVLNGLNFGPLNQKRAKEFDAALPTLLTALDVAQKYEDEFPDDVVESFCNLGAFYFLTHNYDKSDKHFESALNEAMKQERPILEVASIIDYRATVARARNDLNTAESYQELAKNIRAGVFRAKHRDLAHSSHSKALILFDRCCNHYDPEVYRQALQLERKGLGASYGDVLVKMKELAEWIIAKHKQHEGVGTIIGTWHVQTDVSYTASLTTKETIKQDLTGGEERTTGRSEQSSNVANVEVFLCDSNDYSKLMAAVRDFGRQRGLTMNDFRQRWPANHKQADDLLNAMRSTVSGSLHCRVERTDKNGDFEFTDIPPGKYFLYGAVVTQTEAKFWTCPSPETPIVISRKQQESVHFTDANGIVIWQK